MTLLQQPVPALHRLGVELRQTAVAMGFHGATDLEHVDGLLDGAFSALYRQAVKLPFRKKRGAFFTPSHTAQDMVSGLPLDVPVTDPSLGAGDLLIAHSRNLGVQTSLSKTLHTWGKMLRGFELQSDLVPIAKTRLMLAALRRGCQVEDQSELVPENWFPYIHHKDFLEQTEVSFGSIVLNPPFGGVKLEQPQAWGSGQVAKAAVHLMHAVQLCRANSTVSALLPDVIRSGSRYGRLRNLLAQQLSISEVNSVGAFDRHADVDVFTLRGEKRRSQDPNGAWPTVVAAPRVIGDLFDVSVGAVVPHRDVQRGPTRRYADVSAVSAWSQATRLGRPRKFQGTAVEPPLVVLRRTSSPNDRRRAVGAIIKGKGPVAVENHLIVLKPKDGRLESCQALLQILNTDAMDDWLNNRIRCRHLTVGVVRELPWAGGFPNGAT